jgi:hypothetical protein
LLGDGYAQEEFRRHLKGKTTAAQWQEFGTQWQAYVAALREIQRQQLEQLKQAAWDLARGDGQPPNQGSDPRTLG